ncbi:MAG: helix-turn-helix domain-containing protein, partial [Leptothrix ochracea]
AFQRDWLREALTRHAGNQAAVAREAGMHRSNLFRLLRRLGV